MNGVRSFIRLLVKIIEIIVEVSPSTAVILLLIALLQAAAPIGTALITKTVFDQLSGAGGAAPPVSLSSMWWLLGGLLCINLVNSSLNPIGNYLNTSLVRRTAKLVQFRLLAKAESLEGMAHFESPKLHDDLRIILYGTQMAPAQIVGIVVTAFSSLFVITGFAVLLFGLSPLLGALIFAVALPQLFVYMRLTSVRMKFYASLSPEERYAAYLIEHFIDPAKVKEMKVFGFGHHLLSELNDRIDIINARRARQDQLSLRWSIVLQVPLALLSGSAFAVAVTQVIAGRFTLGDVALYSAAVVAVYGALTNLASGLAEAGESIGYIAQFEKFMATPQVLATTEPPVSASTLRSSIVLDNVSFRYDPTQNWVLRNVSLELKKGESVAIVGLNGAGKSTLVKLLARLYDPTEGTIMWDGVDLRCIAPKSLRAQLGVAFQDFVRYDMSARDNIGLGNIGCIKDIDEIARVAHITKANDFLDSLPQGYNTVLSRQFGSGAQGIDLSGGQWQRLAIARALMSNAEFLILDEPSASLDAESEQDIYDSIRTMMKIKTVVVVTHQMSVARMMDKIAVFDQGVLVQTGTHDQLVRQGGKYADLFEIQAAQFAPSHKGVASLGSV